MHRKGRLFIISGPSGVGKGTVCAALMKKRHDLKLSISATTRPKRPQEVDGENYFFHSIEEFNDLIAQGALIEHAQVHGNFYGTPKKFVLDQLELGNNVILEIDVQGAMQVRENMPEAIFIFLLPPHYEDLEKRIRHRGSEDDAQIQLRLKNSKKEIAMLKDYDYGVINKDVDRCVELVSHIIDAEDQRIDSDLLEAYWREFND